MSKKIENTPSVEENPLFHDTWKLLKNYRDAVWNLELAVQHVKNTFEIEYLLEGKTFAPLEMGRMSCRCRYWRLQIGKLCEKH